MPSPELPPRPIARMFRIAVSVGVVAVGAFCLLLLGVRLLVFPQIEAHRDGVARWVAARIGQPVSIGAVITGWNGWNPRLSIRDLRIGAPTHGAPALLDLPRVDLVVAWTSLPLFDLRLKELSIESPTLFVRRDVQGRLHVAGVEVGSDSATADSAVTDWLLRQPRVVVHDALLVWSDSFRGAPQLILDHVNFRLERRFGHVRIGLTGAPPSALAAPLDLRADLSARSLAAPGEFGGRVYLRLDYADLAAWANWLPLPVQVDRGDGALRLWMDLEASQPVRAVADFEVHDLRTTFAAAPSPLVLDEASGRLTYSRNGRERSLRADRLALRLPNGDTMTSNRIDVAYAAGEAAGEAAGTARGRLAFDRVELAPLAEMSAHLPLPAAWREAIASFRPRGSLVDAKLAWTGDAGNPETFAGSARFADVGVAAHGEWPGVDRLSGTLEADQDHGTLDLTGTHASLTLPAYFAAPINLDSIRGRIGWDRRDAPLEVTFTGFAFANADAAGTATATWRDDGAGPGRANASVRLTRARLATVWRYVPSSVPASIRIWLRSALTGGSVTSAAVQLDGDLAEFPFRGGQTGTFTVEARAKDATLAYAEGWPAVTGIAAEVRVAGERLSVDASRGHVLGADIDSVHAEVRDLGATDPVVSVKGTASGATAGFLDVVAKSPMAGRIGEVADAISVSGDAQLALGFDLPLGAQNNVTVNGALSLASNTLRIGDGPEIDELSGDVRFSERGVDAQTLSGRTLGGPVTVTLSGLGSGVTVAASGNADLARLRDLFAFDWLDRISGRAPWTLAASLRDGGLEWSVDASLQDAAIDLPAPLAKPAGTSAMLRIHRTLPAAGVERLVVDCSLADPMHAVIERRDAGEGSRGGRAQVVFGKRASGAPVLAPGASTESSVRGSVTALDADGWLALARASASAAANGVPPVGRVDVDAARLLLAGRSFARTRVTAVRAGDRWQIALSGRDLDGRIAWQPPDATDPQGRMVAHLERLALSTAAEPGVTAATGAPSASQLAEQWPALELDARTFVSRGHALGALTIKAEPDGRDWRIRTLSLANDAGRIDAHGMWHAGSADPLTALEGEVNVREAGAFMSHFGWPDVVKGAPSKIAGRITWRGSPADFDYASLSGAFSLDVGRGQFTKIEPGVGRLLGVLSLQALPRRIGLDFRDVFSEGFAFDKAAGKVTMHDGIMQTDDLKLTGPSAVVDIAGETNLARETQKLEVKVEPALASGISAGAAALFLANPLVGAAVGAGALLAQKLLNNPVDQLFSYEYLVNGSWDDPIVTRATSNADARSAPPVR